MFEPYGQMVWSDQKAQASSNEKSPLINLAIAGGVGGAGFAAGLYTREDGTRGIDNFVSYARTAGNLTPFQLGNTFRIPEFLSVFTSLDSKNKSGNVVSRWSKEALQSPSTFSFLKTSTGLNEKQLAAAGILPQGSTATELIFKQSGTGISGSLYSVHKGKEHLLNDNMLLMQHTSERSDITNILGKQSDNVPINLASKSVLGSMGMWDNKGFNPNELLADGKVRPSHIPIPGFGASHRGTSYPRGIAAFQMNRFNNLLSNIGGEVFGSSFEKGVHKVLGTGIGVRPGTASAMFGRYGMVAAGIGAAGIGVAESDWIRRKFGSPGHLAVSAGIAGGIGVFATRAGFTGKAGAAIAAGSFVGQMLLPGFDKGIVPGLASTYTTASTWRGVAANPFNYYRRAIEGFAPGISSPEFMIGAGLVGVLASGGRMGLKVPGKGRTVPQVLIEQLGHTALGLKPKTINGLKVEVPKTARDLFWDKMLDHANQNINTTDFAKIHKDYITNGGYSTMRMRSRLMKEYGKKYEPHEISQLMNHTFAAAETEFDALAKANPINFHLLDELGGIANKYSGRKDFASRAGMQAEGLMSQLKHSFFGATLHQADTVKKMSSLGFKSPLGSTGLLFAAGSLGWGLATGGILGSMKGKKELEDIYSGKQLVEVKAGRFWEAGGNQLQGGMTTQLRPHWYSTMMSRSKQAGIWGKDEDNIDPISKYALANFTYELERRQYYDRPYPISSAAFANTPIIGGLLSSTIGRLIKPAKIMHASEWARQGEHGMEYGAVTEGWKREASYSLGASKPGVPISPYGASNVLSQLNYQAQELAGLTGYAGGLIQKALTGDSYYHSDSPVLADASMMTSPRRALWDSSLGGMGPLGEVLRRVLPSFPSDVESTNPLMNGMPSWMPDRFHYGDPYTKLPYGESVLPGAGYVALHPELRDVNPEDYPILHRFNILAQTAPFSSNFRKTRDDVYRLRQANGFTSDQEEYIDRLDYQVNRRWAGHTDDRRDPNAIHLPGSGMASSIWLRGQTMLRKQFAPLEYLIPAGFRPLQKLMGERDPIEQYEYERMYGSSVAFWDEPVRDWFRPSFYSLLNFMGYEGKPLWRKQADTTNEYFDKAEFYKWMNKAQEAANQGDTKSKIRYEYLAGNTRMGVNPYGNPLSIYWSLPTEDRAYFNAFAQATGSQRERILEMVPEDQTHLYKAMWNRQDAGDESLWSGLNTNPNRNYLEAQMQHLDKRDLPPVDWIGYNQDVDMRDIKVRYVNNMGRELRDYGLWEQELKKAYSQPYLEGSEQEVPQSVDRRGWITKQLSEATGSSGIRINSSNSVFGNMDMSYYDDRYPEINDMIMGKLNGY